MVRSILLSCTLLAALPLHAGEINEVYRWVDSEGVTHFSNVESDKGEKVEIIPTMTIPAIKGDVTIEEVKLDVLEKPKLSITSPMHDSAYWSTQGNVNINVESNMELEGDMHVVVKLDGRIISHDGMTVDLTNVNRGTHQITAELMDIEGNMVSSTDSTFTIHRAFIKR